MASVDGRWLTYLNIRFKKNHLASDGGGGGGGGKCPPLATPLNVSLVVWFYIQCIVFVGGTHIGIFAFCIHLTFWLN